MNYSTLRRHSKWANISLSHTLAYKRIISVGRLTRCIHVMLILSFSKITGRLLFFLQPHFSFQMKFEREIRCRQYFALNHFRLDHHTPCFPTSIQHKQVISHSREIENGGSIILPRPIATSPYTR